MMNDGETHGDTYLCDAAEPEQWVSNVMELLSWSDEFTTSQEHHVTSFDPCAAFESLAQRRREKRDVVLQARLGSLRFVAEQQAKIGKYMRDRQDTVDKLREKYVALGERDPSKAGNDTHNQWLGVARAQIADVEQRCVQESQDRQAALDEQQADIDESILASRDAEATLQKLELALTTAQQDLARVEEEVGSLRASAVRVDARHLEAQLGETALHVMERWLSGVARHRGMSSEEICERAGEEIAGTLVTHGTMYPNLLQELEGVILKHYSHSDSVSAESTASMSGLHDINEQAAVTFDGGVHDVGGLREDADSAASTADPGGIGSGAQEQGEDVEQSTSLAPSSHRGTCPVQSRFAGNASARGSDAAVLQVGGNRVVAHLPSRSTTSNAAVDGTQLVLGERTSTSSTTQTRRATRPPQRTASAPPESPRWRVQRQSLSPPPARMLSSRVPSRVSVEALISSSTPSTPLLSPRRSLRSPGRRVAAYSNSSTQWHGVGSRPGSVRRGVSYTPARASSNVDVRVIRESSVDGGNGRAQGSLHGSSLDVTARRTAGSRVGCSMECLAGCPASSGTDPPSRVSLSVNSAPVPAPWRPAPPPHFQGGWSACSSARPAVILTSAQHPVPGMPVALVQPATSGTAVCAPSHQPQPFPFGGPMSFPAPFLPQQALMSSWPPGTIPTARQLSQGVPLQHRPAAHLHGHAS
eukprot:TRINITY_DN24235_c0_g1_i1.p1 TRINITY_DN24235_c0_g1~~TRINITY_DN24235_c0_g1_i1.p1  ORF type:complete len:701 (+),score=77.62 TRINITY_DN24235_c0_g1_i1:89-2191(+)